MLRGRCSCAISGRPTPSLASHSPLSPLFPLLPGNLPVTPLFPLLTQKQGGRGCFLQCRSHNPFVFLFCVNPMVIYMSNYIVGAPTILHRPVPQHLPGRRQRASPTRSG